MRAPFNLKAVVCPLASDSPPKEKALLHGKAPVANHRLSYLGFIFPCAQRCFISRDIFLRAAALVRPRDSVRISIVAQQIFEVRA